MSLYYTTKNEGERSIKLSYFVEKTFDILILDEALCNIIVKILSFPMFLFLSLI